MIHLPPWTQIVLVALCVLLAGSTAYGAYRFTTTSRTLDTARSDLASSTQMSHALSDALAASQTERETLEKSLEAEHGKSTAFKTQVGTLTKSVDTLSKIVTTDPQLLAKYSKVYFLNENYAPAKLSVIPSPETYDRKRTYQFHAEAFPFLEDLMKDARKDGMDLEVVSAYRSFGEQSVLKAAYRIRYGAGSANSFSADQGYSEHQLGTAVDFTTEDLGADFSGFEKTGASAWLRANARTYGFVISYPKENTYYTYEPWHWRFVGVELAKKLHDDHAYLYTLDQRDLQPYLATLFDR